MNGPEELKPTGKEIIKVWVRALELGHLYRST